MPFTGVSAMDRKLEFVRLAQGGGLRFGELCRRFGISRTLGYRVMARFQAQGAAGLADRSRRPLTSPRQTDGAIETAVLAVRAEHPAWGGRKIAAVLARQGLAAPSASTVTQILRRSGVALGELGGGAPAFIRFEHPRPNDLWQMDFKGHVPLRQGRLHPLTVLDDHSRFAVVLAACADEQTETVKSCLIKAFERYGLPWRITADNGSPWGNGPRDPYTPLGVWLIERDIRLGHSRPYHPQTQGKDERFHRTLKAEALSGPPFESLEQAARHLDRWRDIYNNERPHDALDLATPFDRYRASPRDYRREPEPFDYAPGDQLRRVQQGGHLSFKNRRIKVPKAFAGKAVALRTTANDHIFEVFFRSKSLGAIDLNLPNLHPQRVTDVSEHLSRMSPV